MVKKNCWELKNCGRQVGGLRSRDLGVCSAAIDRKYNGINSGLNAGRYCWKIAGTLCGGAVQGTWAQKMGNCIICEVFEQIKKEEGASFKP